MYKILTVRDIGKYIDQSDKFLAGLFKKQTNYDEECPDLLDILSQEGIDPSQTESAKNFVTDLKNNLQKLERVQLTLSAEPSYNFTKELYDKVSEIVNHSNFILEIKVNPEIVGGLQISSKGRYVDASVSEKLRKYFSERKNLNELL